MLTILTPSPKPRWRNCGYAERDARAKLAEEMTRVSKALDPQLCSAGEGLLRESIPEKAWCLDMLFLDWHDPVLRMDEIMRLHGISSSLLLGLWRADKGITLTSGSVSSWALHEGTFGEALTDRGTSTRRLTFTAADSSLRGLPTVSANGTSQFLMCPTTAPQLYPMYLRVLAKYGVDEGALWSSSLRYYTYCRVTNPPNSGGTDYQGVGAGAPIVQLAGAVTTSGTWYESEFVWESTPTAQGTIRHNGSNITGALSTVSSTNPMSIFGRAVGSNSCDFLLNGTMYQFIIMNYLPTAGSSFLSYLKTRTNILTNGIAVPPA